MKEETLNNIKKFAIGFMIAYVIISPLLMLNIASKYYHKGQWDGIYIANKQNEKHQPDFITTDPNNTISKNSEEYYQAQRVKNAVSRNIFNGTCYCDLNETQRQYVYFKTEQLITKLELKIINIGTINGK